MPVEPRFRDQIRCLVLKDRRAKALNDALSPDDRIAFNDFLVSVAAVLLVPRLGDRCGVEDIAAFSDEGAARHRRERRPVNEFVVEEILRGIYGLPLFLDVPDAFCDRIVGWRGDRAVPDQHGRQRCGRYRPYPRRGCGPPRTPHPALTPAVRALGQALGFDPEPMVPLKAGRAPLCDDRGLRVIKEWDAKDHAR